MSEQRVPFSVREEARMGLQDWWSDRIDTAVMNQLAGNTAQSDTRYTGNNAAVAPTSTRLVVGGGEDTEASLSATTTHALTLADIDKMVAKAKTLEPLIRPVKVGGEDKYVMFIHPDQMYQLRTSNTSTVGNYVDIFKAAMQGGKYADNPIVTGASFEYNNVIVHESTRVPLVPSQTVYRRAVMCGAQSAVVAYGRGSSSNAMDWNEELFDYGNQLGVEAGLIWGVKKTVFNSADFATIVHASYAPSN
jgi:N4-gp56 family major capsid protein